MNSTAKSVVRSFRGFIALTAVIQIGKSINRTLEDAEANAQKLGKTQQEIDKLTRATGFIDNAFKALKDTLLLGVNGALELKDALTGVAEIDSAGIADKLRLDRDKPKIAEVTETIERLKEQLNSIGETPSQAFARLSQEIERINNASKDISLSEELDALNREAKVLEITAERTQIAAGAFLDYEKSVDAVNEAFDNFQMQQMSAEQQQAKIIEQVISLTDEIANLQALLPEDGSRTFLTLTAEEIAAYEKLTLLQERLVKTIGKRKVLETDLQILARDAGSLIAQGFEDAILSGEKLSDVLKQLGRDLVRLVFQNVVTAPLATGIGNLISGARAEGGPVNSGRSYLVGERGPELFVPGSSGSIVPNDAMRSGGGGGGPSVNITYNIAAGVTRSELGPILESERKRLKAEIPDMVRRGGAYRAAFA
jgi:CRISPR/Cas system-associated protein endoribonuclease Cas2